jgi:glycosyltransferase involved in cell wall biosynthesis
MSRSGIKICVATPEFPPRQWGGLARTVRNVAFHARDLGFDVHVAHFTVEQSFPVLLDENRQTFMDDGITVHGISVGKERGIESDRELWDCPHTLTIQMMYQSLEMLHNDVGFDLYVSFFLYPVGFVTGLLARRMKIPSVVTLVGNDVKRYIFSPEKVGVCRSGLENADRVVTLSHDLMDMADALAPIADKTDIIYNSVEIPEQRWIRERDPGEPFLIGCAGIFKYAKGLPYLFKAVEEIRSLGPLRLELVGKVRDSEQEIYEYMVSKTGLQDVLVQRSRMDHKGILEWLRNLDVFVLPSVTEGCPNILMEALATGVPSIATRTGAAEDLITHGRSGLVVPWGNAKALASAIAYVMQDQRTAKSFGRDARKKMAEFSAETERQAWEQVYRNLLPRWIG